MNFSLNLIREGRGYFRAINIWCSWFNLNVDAVFINKLNFCLNNLKAHNERYQTHIKHLKYFALLLEKLSLKYYVNNEFRKKTCSFFGEKKNKMYKLFAIFLL